LGGETSTWFQFTTWKTLIKTFVNGLVKLGEGGPKLLSNGYGGSLLSGFIIQLRDWEEWLVNNRLRTVGGVGLYRNRKRTLHSFLVNQTFVIPVASKTFLNLIRNEPIKSWNIANKFLINNATPYFNMQRAILLFPGFPHP
jgi:hypothetical protein